MCVELGGALWLIIGPWRVLIWRAARVNLAHLQATGPRAVNFLVEFHLLNCFGYTMV